MIPARGYGWKGVLDLDPLSRDGWRWIAGKRAWAWVRRVLCHGLAHECCESCGKRVILEAGHAHHIFGRGGGRRDDRIFIWVGTLLQRNLLWLCQECHDKIHRPDAFS